MTGDRTTHITATYKDRGDAITCIYAANEKIARELDRTRDWLGRKPAGKALQDWLKAKGCQLDNPDGPAVFRRERDGSMVEAYYRDGKLHREDGPAIVKRSAAGTTEKEYYRDDKLFAGPA